MGRADRRLGWGLFWLPSGVGAVVTLIATPQLPQWSVWVLIIFASVSVHSIRIRFWTLQFLSVDRWACPCNPVHGFNTWFTWMVGF